MATAFDKLYWMRIGIAVVAGIGAGVLFPSDGYNGALVGVLGYLGSYYLARYALFRDVEKASLSKLYTTGIGGYLMLFVFTWVLLFTLSYAGV